MIRQDFYENGCQSLNLTLAMLRSNQPFQNSGDCRRFFARFVSVAALMLAFGCGGGDGESYNDGPTVDCRTEGYGCTGDFSCQLNANDAYECLPANQGGAAGDGGNARDGGAGDGDGDSNSAGDAGDGGNANDGGAAGSSGNEGGGWRQ